MTPTPFTGLRLTRVDADGTVRIEVSGDLDYDSADDLMTAVTAELAAHPQLDDLHLHFGGLGLVDSMGLSVLLMIHRRTTEAGVRLHLDDRTDDLDRLLALTGTLEHFTADPDGAADPAPAAESRPDDGARADPARSAGRDRGTPGH
ncbi:anti-anti-sigma factor [Actinacidiphila alni]|uniref:Anti-anti-sigma factor n=1 Tax=Actinacidiphila alni TaxID=380248 RepID=A0A1I2LK36_9ACTN|nr:STAS domain-containing protein [Actinacidiphila alni]SFF79453.1 anti-anti-sigma factor [Actinacidiphila alni]